jgi:ActR/RegA family two-component response regulator
VTQDAGAATAGTALVICKDEEICDLLIESLRPLAVRPQFCEEVFTARGLLNRRKFEAVIVDLQLGADALLMMEELHSSPANRTAVTFTISAGNAPLTRAVQPDATFRLQRPVSAASLHQTLRAAFGLMVRERRRYFRCPMATAAFLRIREPEELCCQAVNVSEGGIAVRIPEGFDPAAVKAVRFSLPDRARQILSETKVCWHDQAGVVGLQFQSLGASQKSELEEWLAGKLEETLPESVAALFRSARV